MNKYEKLFDQIATLTRSKALTWKQIKRQANADLIFNPSSVFRQFTADLRRGDTIYTLLLVEKKLDVLDCDFHSERHIAELLIVDQEGELVATLTDSVIKPTDLLRLAGMVETQSPKSVQLFEPGAFSTIV